MSTMQLFFALKKETESLKNQYIEMTKEWAKQDFETLTQFAKDYTAGKFGYGEASKKYWKLPHYIINDASSYTTPPVQIYTDAMVKKATEHYFHSLRKLVDRIEAKGLNTETLTVTTSHIGVNIEITLTDGSKKVRAFTIIAGGLIQKPHYRYLIK
jgi:hypothetical protein